MDDQRLKELLSAWFDGELTGEERAQVEAYIERSAEARQIIARYEALKKLTDSSALNLKSDYWERAAAKIEGALGEQTITKVVPVKKSGWSNWGVKAVSIAASVVLLVYVGFHSDEILKRVHQEEQIQEEPGAPVQTNEALDTVDSDESIVQKKAAEDRTIQMFKDLENRQKKEVDQHLNLPPRPKPEPEPEPEKVVEDSRQVEPVLEYESEAATRLRQERSKETTTATKQPSVSSPKSTLAPALTEQNEVKPPANSVAGPELAPNLVGSAQVKTRSDDETALAQEGLDIASEATADSTEEPTQEERYEYLWDHVIAQKVEALAILSPKEYSFDAPSPTLRSGLSDDKGKKKTKEGKGLTARAIERELELIDAALYVGREGIRDGGYDKAIMYLEYVAKEGKAREVRDYARKRLEQLDSR